MKTSCYSYFRRVLLVGIGLLLLFPSQLSYFSYPLLNAETTHSANYTLELSELDALGRAGMAHIRLKESDEPKRKRASRLKYNPAGWHNYRFYYDNGQKRAWLMNRGHLIGYQFSGLENEARNLVPMTAWLNSGNYNGMDKGNPDGMLYYEEHLDNWLALHPNYYLDYAVYPIYDGNNLLPHQILLAYFGIDKDGNKLEIRLGGGRESINQDGVTVVTLDNTSPNATIDYATGVATNTIQKFSEQTSTQTPPIQSAASEASVPSISEDRIVYIARNGTADVYWYSKDRMPYNTNFSNVIEVTEQEAIAMGKRHTSKE